MRNLLSCHPCQTLSVQGLIALTVIWSPGPAPAVAHPRNADPQYTESAGTGRHTPSSTDASVSASPLGEPEGYTDTLCAGWMDPYYAPHFSHGKPYGNEACWCPGSTGRKCTVESDTPAYHLYEFDVPSYADGECWTFTTAECPTMGCESLQTFGVTGIRQDITLYKDEFHPDAPCNPTPTGWCGQTMGCENACHGVDPTVVESLSTGHYYLTVSNRDDFWDAHDPYWYVLHVIHPADTEFRCPALGESGTGRIILVPGFDASSLTHGSEQGHDCEEYFGGLIDTLTASGISREQITTVQTYGAETNCDVDIGDYPANDPQRHYRHFGLDKLPNSHTFPGYGHTLDTSWRHLGYHLAWYLATVHGPIRLIGYSGGGLIIRYALLGMRQGDADFPDGSNIYVADVVTHGTPHRGLPMWITGPCALVPWAKNQQCVELESGSSFIEELEDGGSDARGGYGTEWTATGSNAAFDNYFGVFGCFPMFSDLVIPVRSALGMPGTKTVEWWFTCGIQLDPPLIHVDRSVTHARFGVLGDAYVYYYDDVGTAAEVPATVDNKGNNRFDHVDYATRLAVTARGK